MSDDGLSLYFQLKEGETADLEVVARSALAWAEALRASARAIEPDIEIRIGFVDADAASLTLNTLLEWFDRHVEQPLKRLERGSERLPRTTKLAIGLATVLIITGPQTYDFYFGEGDFTQEDRDALNALAERAAKDPDVQSARRNFYKTLERDHSIVGVGIQEVPKSKPVIVVPSSQFAEGGGLWELEESVQERKNFYVMNVVLVKPALVHTPRTWTFKPDGLPEFDAVMRDEAVLAAMREGLPVDLREGIPMTIRLEVREVLVDREWRVIRGGRSVVKVLSPKID